MLDWLGDVTSTVSFCQISGGVCYPTNLCINCRLCMELCWTYRVCNYAFCIVFEWYFVLIFCLCFMYKLNIFHPLWDQYADSIVKLLAYVPVWCCVLIWQVWSQWIICHILSVHYVVTYANHTFGRHWIIINRQIFWHKSDLTELPLRVQNNGLLRRKHFVAGFSWGMEHYI